MFKNKLNNKGFAVSAILYTLLTAFLLFLGAALAQFSSSAKILSKANNDLTDNTDNTALPYQVRIYYRINGNGGNIKIKSDYKLNSAGECIIKQATINTYCVFANAKSKTAFINIPTFKSCNDLIDDNNFCSNKSWKTTIHYCYKDENDREVYCDLDTSLPGISNKVTMKSINEFVRKNKPDSKYTVKWIQVFHTLTEN